MPMHSSLFKQHGSSGMWVSELFPKLASLLRDLIHEDGGPLIHNGSEEEHRSFDSTCRKLHRFLTQSHL
jgi:hypothetical protein